MECGGTIRVKHRNIIQMGILWDKDSWKQILSPENTTQINYEQTKQHIIGVGNLDINIPHLKIAP